MEENQRFPICKLPKRAISHVLPYLDFTGLLAFSFCTKRCKQLVKLGDFVCQFYAISVDNSVSLALTLDDFILHVCFDYSQWAENDRSVLANYDIRGPVRVRLLERPVDPAVNRQIEYYWNLKVLRMRDVIGHIMETFHGVAVKEIYFSSLGIAHHNMAALFRALDLGNNKVDKLCLDSDCPQIVAKEALKNFVFFKEITLNCDGVSSAQRQELLLHNTDAFCSTRQGEIEGGDLPPEGLVPTYNLDNVLIMNAKNMFILTSKMSVKDLNRFLRLWITGSNQRMEVASIHISMAAQIEREVALQQLMKGIRSKVVEELDEEQRNRMNFYEIYRKDGFIAHVSITLYVGGCAFYMRVCSQH